MSDLELLNEIKTLENRPNLRNYFNFFNPKSDERRIQIFRLVLKNDCIKLFSWIVSKYPYILKTKREEDGYPIYFDIFENHNVNEFAGGMLSKFFNLLTTKEDFLKAGAYDAMITLMRWFIHDTGDKSFLLVAINDLALRYKTFANEVKVYDKYFSFFVRETNLVNIWVNKANLPITDGEESNNVLNKLIDYHLQEYDPDNFKRKVLILKARWGFRKLITTGNIQDTGTPLQNLFALQTFQKYNTLVLGLITTLLSKSDDDLFVLTTPVDPETLLRKIVSIYNYEKSRGELDGNIIKIFKKLIESEIVLEHEQEHGKESGSAWEIVVQNFELKKYFLLIPGLADEYFEQIDHFGYYDLGWDEKVFEETILEKAPVETSYKNIAESLIDVHNNNFLKLVIPYLTKRELTTLINRAQENYNLEGAGFMKERMREKDSYKVRYT